MYLTQTNYIRHLPKDQYEAILEMCAYANNLYNVGLYQIRQYFFATNKYLRYEENYHLCKDNENYKLLQAGVSQQILRTCDHAFRSFFALLSKKNSGGYEKEVRIPHYRTKGGKYLERNQHQKRQSDRSDESCVFKAASGPGFHMYSST